MKEERLDLDKWNGNVGQARNDSQLGKGLDLQLGKGLDLMKEEEKVEEKVGNKIEEAVGLEDYVGAIFGELVEMNERLGEFMKVILEETKDFREKKGVGLGFKIGADVEGGKVKGETAVSRIFGNVR